MQDYRGRSLQYPIHSVIFDFDGTLVDLYQKWWKPVESAFLNILGSVPEDRLRGSISSIFARFPTNQSKLFLLKVMYSLGRGGGLSRIQSLRFLLVSRTEYAKTRHTNIPFDGIKEMIQELQHRGYSLAIASSASRSELEGAIQNYPYLDLPRISRHDVALLKPDPSPIIAAMDLIQADPKSTLYVGDFHTDIIAAKAANVQSCAVLGPYPDVSRAGVEKENPDIIIDHTVDLLSFLE